MVVFVTHQKVVFKSLNFVANFTKEELTSLTTWVCKYERFYDIFIIIVFRDELAASTQTRRLKADLSNKSHVSHLSLHGWLMVICAEFYAGIKSHGKQIIRGRLGDRWVHSVSVLKKTIFLVFLSSFRWMNVDQFHSKSIQ